MWMPLPVVLFELFANRVQIRINHISYQVIIFGAYVFATGLGEALNGYPIFPQSFDWNCENSAQGCWNSLISTMLYMFSLQIAFFLAFWAIHFFRNKWVKSRFQQN